MPSGAGSLYVAEQQGSSDCESDLDGEDSDEDHEAGGFDWLEHAVMSAVEYDMKLAVDLINSIERGWKSACQAREDRVHGWRQTASGHPDQTDTTPGRRAQSPSSQGGRPRKRPKPSRLGRNSRQYLGNDGDEEEEEEESDQERNEDPSSRPRLEDEQRLVCPFFKRFPEKYGPHGKGPRACFGRGYTKIKDLRCVCLL